MHRNNKTREKNVTAEKIPSKLNFRRNYKLSTSVRYH